MRCQRTHSRNCFINPQKAQPAVSPTYRSHSQWGLEGHGRLKRNGGTLLPNEEKGWWSGYLFWRIQGFICSWGLPWTQLAKGRFKLILKHFCLSALRVRHTQPPYHVRECFACVYVCRSCACLVLTEVTGFMDGCESACELLEINSWSYIIIISALNWGDISPAFKGVFLKTMFKDIMFRE